MTALDPAGIDAVFLDAGNTLLFLDLERVLPVVREAGGQGTLSELEAAEREARRTLHGHMREGSTGLEMEAWRAYFMDIMDRVQVPLSRLPRVAERLRALHETRHLWTRVEPGAPEALRTLRAAGYRAGVISNADGRMERLLHEVGLATHLEVILDSEEVGLEKPDPEIFLRAAHLLAVQPHRCLYVGDLVPVDVRGAQGAGMEAVLVDPEGHGSGAGVPRIASVADLPGLLGCEGAEREGGAGPPRPWSVEGRRR